VAPHPAYRADRAGSRRPKTERGARPRHQRIHPPDHEHRGSKAMKKFMNGVEDVLTESLDGLVEAHSAILTLGGGHKFIRRRVLKPGKVALLSAGGSGHEPLHGGLVGHGMLDAACPGQVFTSPTPDQMLEAAADVDTGAGCLFIVKNYEGDVMNFDMAAEMSE